MAGKCPKCAKLVTRANCSDMEMTVLMGTAWKGAAYTCPHCQTILGCQIDPVALKTDTVNQIVNELFKRLRG